MAFHHLFLALGREFPAIAAEAAAFRAREAARVKHATPNLGEFLCILAVTDVSWEEIAVPLLEEAFDRNVLWALKAHPQLVDVAKTGDAKDARVRLSFAANTVSLRLLSFQAWFMRKVARPPQRTCADVLAGYDRTKGVPPAALVDALQDHCKALAAMRSH